MKQLDLYLDLHTKLQAEKAIPASTEVFVVICCPAPGNEAELGCEKELFVQGSHTSLAGNDVSLTTECGLAVITKPPQATSAPSIKSVS